MLDLDYGTALLRLLGEPTRLRLLLLLETEALSVAELTAITGLAQSRISSHLARLRQAGLVSDERAGNATFYRADPARFPPYMRQLWGTLLDNLDDIQVARDAERAAEIVRRRGARSSWVESVAGRMERQYSPGRTWEATARTLIGLLKLGDVLDLASGDGVLTELLAGRAQTVTCLDINPTVIDAGRKRLADHGNVRFQQGDMHALPYAGASFDQVFLMHALSYTRRAAAVISEAARVLRPGGKLALATLRRHRHRATVSAFDHVNLGFEPEQLRRWSERAGLIVDTCDVGCRENRPPYFEVIGLIANKPSSPA